MSFFEFLMRIGQNVNSNIFPNLKHKTAVCWKGVRAVADFQFLLRERERERLLSRFPGNPIVEILRSKKESCSTQRGQRVGIDFE